MKGKFIALYGTNNKGKTTQIHRVVDWLTTQDIKAEYLKYPVYDMEPFGPIINEYLRGGNPHDLTPFQIQQIYMLNRDQYQPTLIEKLESGVWVLAEDYVGTGIAWGMATGLDKEHLEYSNKHLIKPDFEILFEGRRFLESIEAGHLYENDDDLTRRSDQAHKLLAMQNGWTLIQSDMSLDDVTKSITNRLKIVFEM